MLIAVELSLAKNAHLITLFATVAAFFLDTDAL